MAAKEVKNAMKNAMKKAKTTARKLEMDKKAKLINEVRNRPALWNRKDSGYKDRNLADKLWGEIAGIMAWSKNECKRIWKHLVDHFRNLYFEALQKRNDDSAESLRIAITSVKWQFFRQMCFLRTVVAKRSLLDDAEVPAEMNETIESLLETELTTSDSANNDDITDELLPIEPHLREENESGPSQACSLVSPIPMNNPPVLIVRSEKPFANLKQKRVVERAVLVDQSEITRELVRPADDTAGVFASHVGNLLREVPQHLRHQCEFHILQLMYAYLNGENVDVSFQSNLRQ